MGKGILLDDDNDLLVLNGSLVIGETEMQETALIIQLSQGECKHDPILGPDLIQLKKSNASKFDIEKRLRIHLARDGKDYGAIKESLKTNLR